MTQVSDLLRRIHETALSRRIAFGQALWTLYPPAIAVRIIEAGLVVEEIDFNPDGAPIIMDSHGDLFLCEVLGVSPCDGSAASRRTD